MKNYLLGIVLLFILYSLSLGQNAGGITGINQFSNVQLMDISILTIDESHILFLYKKGETKEDDLFGKIIEINSVTGAIVNEGSETTIEGGFNVDPTADLLSSTEAIIRYIEPTALSGDSYYAGSVKIKYISFDTSNETINTDVASATIFSGTSNSGVSIGYIQTIKALSATTFVTGYSDYGPQLGYVYVGTISVDSGTNTLTMVNGTSSQYSSSEDDIDITKLSSSSFILGIHRQFGDSSTKDLLVGSISGSNAITLGTMIDVDTSNPKMIKVAAINSTQFVAAYFNNSGPSTYVTKFKVGTVSGTTITLSATPLISSIDSGPGSTFRLEGFLNSNNEFTFVLVDAFSNLDYATGKVSGTSTAATVELTNTTLNYATNVSKFPSIAISSPTTFYIGYSTSTNGTIAQGTLIPSVTITGDAGWRLLSVPVANGTLEQLSDETAVQGVTGGDGVGKTPNVILYDSDATFEQPATITTTWGDGVGVGVYFFNNNNNGSSEFPVTLTAVGEEPSSDVTVPLNPALGGFTFVGNPFASNIDLNSLTADGSGISNNVAFWDDGNSQYSIQNRTTPYIIAPWQGFWVETVSGVTTLTIPTSAKTTSSTTATYFSKAASNRADLSVRLSSETTNDNVKVAFRASATLEYDKDDFGKLTPLSSIYAAVSIFNNNRMKGVESLPYDLEQEITLPTHIDLVGVEGEFTLDWTGLDDLPSEWELIFHDYELGTSMNMREQSQYTFEAASESAAKVNPLSILTGPAAITLKAKQEHSRFGLTIRPSSVSNEPDEKPIIFSLDQNYPNPFNPSTTIDYSIENFGLVSIRVYNVMGREVATLVHENKAAGRYTVSWNSTGISSGMYYYRLEANGQAITRKMTLIK